MAYAAAVSVVQILKQLLYTDAYPFEYPKPQIESLYDKVLLLQSCLEEIFPAPKSKRGEANDLEIQIRDVIYDAQDTLEFFISRSSQSSSNWLFLKDLEEVIAKLDPITTTAALIRVSLRESIQETQTGDLSTENAMLSHSSCNTTRIVGLHEDLMYLKDMILGESMELQVVPITGLPGVGKTTLARIFYEDPLVVQHFDIRCWVTVSEEYHVEGVLREILSCTRPSTGKGGREEVMERLYKALKGMRYLIVMDDIWDTNIWDDVRRCFPDDCNQSRIILTTRNAAIADYCSVYAYCHVMCPLDQEKSWTLLRETVFGPDRDCPPELENIGRSIAEKCGGIPLSIVVVGGLLSNTIRTVEYWTSIEEDVHGAAARGDESYSEILSLSYQNLPSRLKACFLYIGAFPKDSEILVSKLIKLWVAEGFLAPPSSPSQSLEQVANQHFKDLIVRNLISVRKVSFRGQAKTCSIQDNLRRFAEEECQKEKFFHAINRYAQELSEGTENQRRICVHKNILMCAEDVYRCTKSIKLARTLVYAGPNHHHPLPFCLTFDLLRVLDALSVYFIELPNALFELIHLRFLAFTYDEDLPPSISKLRNLMILIVQQHPKIIIRRPLILPVEIWNMSQVRHLLFSEIVLPYPCGTHNSVLLENLQCLSNINAACCTKEILQNMPNLKKLGIWIEAPGTVHCYLDQLPHLETLKFTVLKPNPEEKIDFVPKLVFPKTLKTLCLRGCGIPWEDMKTIGQLPCLEVLKLRELAFQGPEWCPDEGEFLRLEFLLLDSLDLVGFLADDSNFPSLKCLIIRHCYELEEIPSAIGEIPTLELIELVHCSPPAVLSACRILDEQESFGNGWIRLRIHSSREWEQQIREELVGSGYEKIEGIHFSWE